MATKTPLMRVPLTDSVVPSQDCRVSKAELHEGDVPVESVDADLQHVGALLDGRDGAVEQCGQKEWCPIAAPGARFLRDA